MVYPVQIREFGNQLSVLMDDGSTALCVPTSGGFWICSADTGSGSGDIAWPFSQSLITSGYGPRTGGAGTFHEGVDFSGGAAVAGADIRCAANGTVKMVANNSGFGNYVAVFHKTIDTFDFWTVYGHLATMTVSVNDPIVKGDKLGTLGDTGTVTGFVLHWETHKCAIGGSPVWNLNDDSNPRTAVDPVPFMSTYGSSEVLNA